MSKLKTSIKLFFILFQIFTSNIIISIDDQALTRIEMQEPKNHFFGIDYPNQEVIEAIQLGDIESLQVLMSLPDFNINYENQNGTTPLLLAISKQDLPIIQLLIQDKRLNINYENQNGTTPLLLAISKQNLLIIQTLRNKNASISIANKNRILPLSYAQSLKNPLLLSCLTNPNFPNEEIMTTIYQKNESLLKTLLTLPNANINYEDSNGNTPLLLAIQTCQLSIIHYLISLNASIFDANSRGISPIQYAFHSTIPHLFQLQLREAFKKIK